MFDLSFAEIALIIIVAVIFIGPEELPVVIKAIVKAGRSIRNFTQEVRAMFDDISKESGLHDELSKDMRLIKGDDGKLYESYNIPFPSKPAQPLDKPQEAPAHDS